jgi:hypothetical protein
VTRPPLDGSKGGTTAAQAFAFQAAICRHLGGDLSAQLLDACANDAGAAAIVSDWPGDLLRDFVPLRLLGGVHQLVLGGQLPGLATHYPTAGGRPNWPAAGREFLLALRGYRPFLRDFLATAPQTNEIGRSAALTAGFHEVVLEFGQPLRLRELGASAGLNLLFDDHAYHFGNTSWGEGPGRPLLQPRWSGPAPRLAGRIVVESRAGCDLSPIDLSDPGARARLCAYVWADHPERLDRLRIAIERALPRLPRLERRGAGDWVGGELAVPATNVTTVMYHSSFWSYLADAERASIRSQIEAAGRAATRESPLAWLRLEDVEHRVELWMRTWPGGSDRQLAETDPHGHWIDWKGRGAGPA